MIITERIEASDKILASGGFADVRSGRYMGRLVAVKTLRVTEQDDLLRIRKVSTNDVRPVNRRTGQTILFQRFCKEVVLWSTLSHPNVLKLAGVQGDMEKGQFATVSEWMAHGNIMEYIRNNRVNRLELVRDFTFPATSFVKMRQ
jgi:serine/threonine protein kinase